MNLRSAPSSPLTTSRSLRPHVLKLWQLVALLLGAFLSVATSHKGPPVNRPVEAPGAPGKMLADAVLHNGYGAPIHVQVAWPDDDVRLDCGALEFVDSPEAVEGRFTTQRSWQQAPGENAGLWAVDARSHVAEQRGCYVVKLTLSGVDVSAVNGGEDSLRGRLRVDSGAPLVAYVFWRSGELGVQPTEILSSEPPRVSGVFVVAERGASSPLWWSSDLRAARPGL